MGSAPTAVVTLGALECCGRGIELSGLSLLIVAGIHLRWGTNWSVNYRAVEPISVADRTDIRLCLRMLRHSHSVVFVRICARAADSPPLRGARQSNASC